MENRNFRSYTVQDVVDKMKKLRQKYKRERQVQQEWNRQKEKMEGL